MVFAVPLCGMQPVTTIDGIVEVIRTERIDTAHQGSVFMNKFLDAVGCKQVSIPADCCSVVFYIQSVDIPKLQEIQKVESKIIFPLLLPKAILYEGLSLKKEIIFKKKENNSWQFNFAVITNEEMNAKNNMELNDALAKMCEKSDSIVNENRQLQVQIAQLIENAKVEHIQMDSYKAKLTRQQQEVTQIKDTHSKICAERDGLRKKLYIAGSFAVLLFGILSFIVYKNQAFVGVVK